MTVKASTIHHDLLYFCMVMRINIDCTGCYRKVKRALLDMPELDSHLLEKKQTRVVVCGRFIPQDVAIKIKKKTNRRVEILDIQDMSENNAEMENQKPMTNSWTLLATQNQMETCHA
ncbi:heavy metal-associated isoprenylated plant protein 26 isoform X1 [Cajanus cajan]|nr:heavy metal-associated isoprenylated plant protein 26 isoform X1 [Cajanus cajan]